MGGAIEFTDLQLEILKLIKIDPGISHRKAADLVPHGIINL